MRLTDALSKLKKMKQPVFRTADVMALLNVNKSHASVLLSRLSSSGHLIRLKRGLWAFVEGSDPLLLSEYLTAPFPSYISLQTALYYHGMISQIPVITYVISTARTTTYETVLGAFSIHHVSASYFFGYESVGEHNVKMATPEKALLDFLYLSPAKSRLFGALPELELPQRFSVKAAQQLIRGVQSGKRRTLLERRFKELIERLVP